MKSEILKRYPRCGFKSFASRDAKRPNKRSASRECGQTTSVRGLLLRPAPPFHGSCLCVTSGAGTHEGAGRCPRRLVGGQPPSRALDYIWSKLGASRAGAALPGWVRPQRLRAGRAGASGSRSRASDRPLRARHARRRLPRRPRARPL